jgi:epoxyqueuosine reductase QueG
MVAIHQARLSAADVKAKARALGADLVGIADGGVMDANPPDPARPRRPSDITDHDAGRVIVLARRLSRGTSRILPWNERHKYYNDELAITALEETALELVLWLEDNGYPALIVPPNHVDPMRYMDDPEAHLTPLLSLEHAAVEAGLGTLGLNLQLLTPEFGPRVVLTAVLSSVDVEADRPMAEALCLGPECGRCLQACPGDVIGHWDRDWPACDRFRSPHGFAQLTEFLGEVIERGDAEEQKKMLRSQASFELWQSILRGAGVVTGCRRCQDVCPVGADYETLLRDAVDAIQETTAEKTARLATMVEAEAAGAMPDGYRRQQRWIGRRAGRDQDQ